VLPAALPLRLRGREFVPPRALAMGRGSA